MLKKIHVDLFQGCNNLLAHLPKRNMGHGWLGHKNVLENMQPLNKAVAWTGIGWYIQCVGQNSADIDIP